MKDFKKKDLYDQEEGKFRKFLESKLVTKSEYNRFDTGDGEDEDEFEMESLDHVLGFGDMEDNDFGGLSSGGFDDFSNFGFDGFNSSGNGSKVDYNSWQNETSELNKFLKAPIYLSSYVFNTLIYRGEEKKDDDDKINFDLKHMKSFFKYTTIMGIFMIITSLLGYTSLNFNALHNKLIGAIFGVLLIVIGDFFNWRYFNQGLLSKVKPNENPLSEVQEETSELGETGDFDFGDFGNEFGEGMSDSFDEPETLGGLSTLDLFDDDDEYGSDLGFGDDDDDDYDEDSSDDTILGESTVQTKDNVLFQRELIAEFNKNARYQGMAFRDKKSTLDSFANLLLNNDKNFAKWKTEREKSRVYNNIAYTLYKAFLDISPQFKKDENAKMTVLSVQSTPLLYKIEVILPQSHFKGDKLQRGINDIQNHLKRDASDSEVQAMVSMSGDTYTIRLIRMDYGGLISIGDILRYKDDSGMTAYQRMTNPKSLTPMLVGLRDNEYPHVIDLQKNTAMAIVGGSGSGKSWLTYELGTNIVTTNSYKDVNFIVLDYKNAPFWQAFARMPHVLGYHSPNANKNITPENFLDLCLEISNEVVKECTRRQSYLGEKSKEDAIEFRETYYEDKNFEELDKLPLLVFVIDEITTTMGELAELDKEKYDTFRNNLKTISQVGRSAGVRLLTVGQRAIDTSLPKNVRANSTLLFGMKMNAQSDFGMLFEGSKEVEKMAKPQKAGQGIVTSEDHNGYFTLKTLTPGGAGTPQIRKLLRTIAFDWVRRAKGIDDLYNPPYKTDFKKAYNRNEYLDLTYQNLKNGQVLEDDIISEDAMIDLTKNAPISLNTEVLTETSSVVFQESDDLLEQEPIVELEPIKNTDTLEDNLVDVEVEKEYSGDDFTDYFQTQEKKEQELVDTNFSDLDDSYEDDLESSSDLEPISFDLETDFEFEDMGNGFDVPDDFQQFIKESDKDIQESIEDSRGVITDFEFEDDLYESESTESIDLDNDFVEELIEETPDTIEQDTQLDDSSEIDKTYDTPYEDTRDIFDIINSIEEENYEDSYEPDSNDLDVVETITQEQYDFEQKQKELKEREEQMEKEFAKKEALLRKELEQKELALKKQAEKEKLLAIKEQEKKQTKPKQSEPVVDNVPTPQGHGMVQVGFNSTSVSKSAKVNKMEIRQYIIEYGTNYTQFEWVIPKEVLLKEYTKAEINKALHIGDILESKDAYISTL